MSVYQHAGCDYLLWTDHLALSIPAGYRDRAGDGLSLPHHLDLADMERHGTGHISHSYFIMSFSDQTENKVVQKKKEKQNVV